MTYHKTFLLHISKVVFVFTLDIPCNLHILEICFEVLLSI